MVQKITVTAVCDMDSRSHSGPVETVRFSFGGMDYEIELCQRDAVRFHVVTGAWVKHARKQPRQRKRATRSGSMAAPLHRRSVAQRALDAEIRAYASTQGIAVNSHGRLPEAALRAWDRRN